MGYLHTVWCDSANRKVYYAKSIDEGHTWSNGEGGIAGTCYEVYSGFCGTPVIAVDSNNYIYIVFRTQSVAPYKLYLRRRTSSWQVTDTTSLDVAAHNILNPKILIDTSNNIHIFADNRTDTHLYWSFSIDNGVNWTKNESAFTDLPNNSLLFDFDIDINKNIHLVYGYSTKVNYIKGTYTSPSTWIWGSVQPIADSHYMLPPIHLLCLTNGDIHIYWVAQTFEGGGGDYDGYLRRILYSGSWGSIISQFSIGTYLNRPFLGRDKNDNIHCFTYYYGSTNWTYYRKYSNYLWSSSVNVSESGTGYYPNTEKVVLVNTNYFGFVYTDTGDSPDSIRFDSVEVTQNTIWQDINTDIRCAAPVLSDISTDIRCVSTHVAIRDLNCDVRCVERMFYDMNTDIRCIAAYPSFYNMSTDIRSAERKFYNINCDIRCIKSDIITGLSDMFTDIRCLARQFYNINCDIRCNPPLSFYDIGCDIRCRKQQSAGLDAIRVKLDGVYLSDIDNTTIKFDSTSDETPG